MAILWQKYWGQGSVEQPQETFLQSEVLEVKFARPCRPQTPYENLRSVWICDLESQFQASDQNSRKKKARKIRLGSPPPLTKISRFLGGSDNFRLFLHTFSLGVQIQFFGYFSLFWPEA